MTPCVLTFRFHSPSLDLTNARESLESNMLIIPGSEIPTIQQNRPTSTVLSMEQLYTSFSSSFLSNVPTLDEISHVVVIIRSRRKSLVIEWKIDVEGIHD